MLNYDYFETCEGIYSIINNRRTFRPSGCGFAFTLTAAQYKKAYLGAAALYAAECRTDSGAILSIGFYKDTPNKNYRIYYDGSDTGKRYERLGNAAREIKRVAIEQRKNGVKNTVIYKTRSEIPTR